MQYVVVIAVGSLLVGGCSKYEADSAGEPIAAGIDAEDRDVAEHIEALLQSVGTLQASGSIRGRLGMAYDVNGFRDEAIATYQQASLLDPRDFRWPYFNAQLVAEGGEYESALELLDRALATDPEYAPAWLWRGSWLLKANRPQDAMDAYRRAGELQRSPHADFGRAQAMMAVGESSGAVEILEPLAKAFNHPYVHRTLGEALRAIGRLDDARRAMERGREAQPLTWPDQRREQRSVHIRGHASYMLAKQLSASGRLDEAIAILQRLQGHHPEEHCGRDLEFFLACNLMNSMGIAYDRAGRSEQSLATIQRGLILKPTFAPFHLTIANLLRDERDLESALDHVERAIELSPNTGYAHEQRGRLLFGLENFRAAEVAFETALQHEPGKRTTLFYLGLAQVELSRYHDAVESFQRVTDVEPHFALGHVFLARSLGEIGRIDEARQAQDLARRYGADSVELRRNEVRLRELEANAQGDASG